MGLISTIEGMWDFATMGNCHGEEQPLGVDENQYEDVETNFTSNKNGW